MKNIPFMDLGWQSEIVRDAVMKRLGVIADRSDFILGHDVGVFELEYSEFLSGLHVLAVSNGTDALELALRALELPSGSEVLVPANSFIASALAVIRAGLRVRFVDVLPDTLLADASTFEAGITETTRVLMPVHLYGQCARMDEIMALARMRGLYVVEDAAQAQGASFAGIPAGGWGDIGATSFYPGKNLGAWGDAGAIITRSDELLARAKALRNYGSKEKYHHTSIGFNCRMDSVQAVVLSEKLRYLPEWNAQRETLASVYRAGLEQVAEIGQLLITEGGRSVFHLFVVQVERRDTLIKYLAEHGVQALIHYPIPIHRQQALAGHEQYLGDFPVTDQASTRILSLPLFPGMSVDQVEYVVSLLADYSKNSHFE